MWNTWGTHVGSVVPGEVEYVERGETPSARGVFERELDLCRLCSLCRFSFLCFLCFLCFLSSCERLRFRALGFSSSPQSDFVSLSDACMHFHRSLCPAPVDQDMAPKAFFVAIRPGAKL